MSYAPLQPTEKRNAVRQLLRDYAPWHFAGGAAAELNLESRGGYGPAGMAMPGGQFEKEQRAWYRFYFDALEKALTVLEHQDPDARAILDKPYLRDPADADYVRLMEEKAGPARRHERNARAPVPDRYSRIALDWIDLHERAVDLLAGYLVNVDLQYVVFPKARNSKFAEDVQSRNDGFYDLVCVFVAEGMKRNKAIEKAADQSGIGRSRAWVIVDVREKPVETTVAD